MLNRLLSAVAVLAGALSAYAGITENGGLAGKAAELEKIIDERFLDGDGLLRSMLKDDWTPFDGPVDGEDMQMPGVHAERKDYWNYENSGMVHGAFLAAMCAEYAVTGDGKVREKCRRTYRGIRRIYELSAPVGKGFFCKPYGGRMSDETSSDQYVYAMAGLDAYYQIASSAERAEISRMVGEMVSFWIDRGYSYKYYGAPLAWQKCRFISFAALAARLTGETKFRDELQKLLGDPAVTNDIPFRAALELRHSIPYKPTDLRNLYFLDGESVMSGWLSVAALLDDDPGAAYPQSILDGMLQLARTTLSPDGTCIRTALKNGDGSFRELPRNLMRFNTPKRPPPWNWSLYGLTAPVRHGGKSCAMCVNALVQMASCHAGSAEWVHDNAEAMLSRLAEGRLAWFEDPFDVLPMRLKWITKVRSGDAISNWLWAYWTLRLREKNANMLNNPSFAADGRGGIRGWRTRSPVTDKVRRLGAVGSGGTQAVSLDISDGRFFEQPFITLEPGEPYRLSAYVRTRGLGEKSIRLLLWNRPWNATVDTGFLPQDTHGEWVRMEKTSNMVEDSLRQYTFGFYLASPSPGATVEIADLRLEPLSVRAASRSRHAQMPVTEKVRIVPVFPMLANVDAAKGAMKFYYPGDRPSGAELLLEASVDGRPVAVAAVGEGNRAELELGRTSPGRHKLDVRIVSSLRKDKTLAHDSYKFTSVARSVASGGGKRLNNLVTELVSCGLRDGEYVFERPTDGWTWISLEDCGRSVRALLDGGTESVVVDRPHERMETMRYLSAGRHVLAVSGVTGNSARLRINAVPKLIRGGMDLRRVTSDISKYEYGLDFYSRYFFGTCNSIQLYYWRKHGAMYEPRNRILAERGMHVAGTMDLPSISGTWADSTALVNAVTSSPTFVDGLDLVLDEAMMAAPRANHDATAEAFWTVGQKFPNACTVFWCDPMKKLFSDPVSQTSELAAIFNTGGGRGITSLETYAGVLADQKSAFAQIDHFRDIVAGVERMVPGGAGHVNLYFAGYMSPEGWNSYPSPEADFKVFFDEFFRRAATDEGFKGLGCIGFGAPFHIDEEVIRWFSRLMRHYCLEGSVESLAARYGYRYNPGFIANPDFADGFKGWTVKPAEKGSLVPDKIAKYGTDHTYRKEAPKGTGDTVARFRRSAAAPNMLSQRMRLKKGCLYSVTCCCTDADDVKKPGSVGDERAFSILLDGAERIDELSYVRMWPEARDSMGRRLRNGKPSGGPRSLKYMPRVVFRALSDDVEIVFSDWATPDAPGAPTGRTTLMNYILMRPYYLESEEEFADLKRLGLQRNSLLSP